MSTLFQPHLCSLNNLLTFSILLNSQLVESCPIFITLINLFNHPVLKSGDRIKHFRTNPCFADSTAPGGMNDPYRYFLIQMQSTCKEIGYCRKSLHRLRGTYLPLSTRQISMRSSAYNFGSTELTDIRIIGILNHFIGRQDSTNPVIHIRLPRCQPYLANHYILEHLLLSTATHTQCIRTSCRQWFHLNQPFTCIISNSFIFFFTHADSDCCSGIGPPPDRCIYPLLKHHII